MGLKLTVSKGDKIHIGDDTVLVVRSPAQTKMQVEIDAPQEVAVWTEFADKTKQNKNVRKANRINVDTTRRVR